MIIRERNKMSKMRQPLLKLRRDTDDIEQVFFADKYGNLNHDDIETWANGSQVFVVTIYDQRRVTLREHLAGGINFLRFLLSPAKFLH